MLGRRGNGGKECAFVTGNACEVSTVSEVLLTVKFYTSSLALSISYSCSTPRLHPSPHSLCKLFH